MVDYILAWTLSAQYKPWQCPFFWSRNTTIQVMKQQIRAGPEWHVYWRLRIEQPMLEDELYRHTRYRFLCEPVFSLLILNWSNTSYRSNDAENMAKRYLNFNLPELIDIAIKAAGNGAKSCENPVQVTQMFTSNRGLFYRYKIAQMPWRPFQQSLYSDYGQWHRSFCETSKSKCWAKILHDCIRGCDTGICVFHSCF